MSEPKPKKMVNRNIAIALGIICILLIAVVAYFSIIGISAQNSYNNLQNQNKQLQAWLNGNKTLLRQTETWLNGNITYYNTQVTNLQNQLSNFTWPKLGFSDLTVVDNRTNPDNTFLQVNGTIHNFGINGTMADVLATAYHDDGSIALSNEYPYDSQSTFLNIDGLSSVNVNFIYLYNGSALASWTISVNEIIYV